MENQKLNTTKFKMKKGISIIISNKCIVKNCKNKVSKNWHLVCNKCWEKYETKKFANLKKP